MNLETHWSIVDALERAGLPTDTPPVGEVIAAIVDAQGRIGLDGLNDATHASVERMLGASLAYNMALDAIAKRFEASEPQRAKLIRRAALLVTEDANTVARSAGIGEA